MIRNIQLWDLTEISGRFDAKNGIRTRLKNRHLVLRSGSGEGGADVEDGGLVQVGKSSRGLAGGSGSGRNFTPRSASGRAAGVQSSPVLSSWLSYFATVFFTTAISSYWSVSSSSTTTHLALGVSTHLTLGV